MVAMSDYGDEHKMLKKRILANLLGPNPQVLRGVNHGDGQNTNKLFCMEKGKAHKHGVSPHIRRDDIVANLLKH